MHLDMLSLEETGGTMYQAATWTSFNSWAAWYKTWLLIKLMLKGVVSFLYLDMLL